jgi:uncharacterized membrane protein
MGHLIEIVGSIALIIFIIMLIVVSVFTCVYLYKNFSKSSNISKVERKRQKDLIKEQKHLALLEQAKAKAQSKVTKLSQPTTPSR